MKKNENKFDIMGMAWSDKISFEEIKKNLFAGKRSYFHYEQNIKKK